MNRFHEVNELHDGTMDVVHHFCFHTNIISNECFAFQQAIKQDDIMLFVEAMEKEINSHEEGNHWTIVQRSSVPVTVKTIKAIWSFNRKRKPYGELLKHKAQICSHGGMQKWVESYWETYSPVVNMLIVRLLLCIEKNTKFRLESYRFCVGIYSS